MHGDQTTATRAMPANLKARHDDSPEVADNVMDRLKRIDKTLAEINTILSNTIDVVEGVTAEKSIGENTPRAETMMAILDDMSASVHRAAGKASTLRERIGG
jgi:histidinol phosphatase-like PHP family hydrolase